MNKKFQDMTLNEYLSLLGSTKPAPGGGAAAAFVAAEACALGEMVCRLVSHHESVGDFRDKAESYVDVFVMARAIFLDLMDDDAANFKALMDLWKKKDTPKAVMEEAFKKSAEAPWQMGSAMTDLLPAFTELIHHAPKLLLTDAVLAAEQAISAIRGAELNVKINTKYIKDDIYIHETEESMEEWEHAISAIEAVLTYQVTL
jgi:hypothetical protein